MVKEGEPALSPPSAAESDHNHSVEEETAVTEPLQKSKEVLQKSKEILQKPKEILQKFKESYKTSQESKEVLGVADNSIDIYRESLPFGRQLSPFSSVFKLVFWNNLANCNWYTLLLLFIGELFWRIYNYPMNLGIWLYTRGTWHCLLIISQNDFFRFFLLILIIEMCFLLYH